MRVGRSEVPSRGFERTRSRGVRKTAPTIALLCVVLACGAPTFPDRQPTIAGEVVGIGAEVPFGSARSVWVKESPADPCGIVFRVTEDTEIGARASDDSVDPRRFDDLAIGRDVRVWSGPIAESCPGQGRADAIEILS